jgi:uncharacterized protein YajQ (UPF0234 family)
MADLHSFDIASKIDFQELDNAINQTLKEVSTRYDLKDANASLEFKESENKLYFVAKDDFKVKAVLEIFKQKLVKRNISPKALDEGEIKTGSGGSAARLEVKVQQGIPQDKAKEMVKDIKAVNKNVQAQIQGDQVRITSKKIDDLQTVIAFLKDKDYNIHMQFLNYR